MTDHEMNYYSDLADAAEKYSLDLDVYSEEMASRLYKQAKEDALERFNATL